MFEKYTDTDCQNDFFPEGKIFRIQFDPVQFKWRLFAKYQSDFESVVEAFKTPNPTMFYSKMYGFEADKYLYSVNKFGFFSIGLIFEVFDYIKKIYGSLECVKISKPAGMFLKDYLMPLKKFADTKDKNTFEISNISNEYKLRTYQEQAIKSIIFKGYGRGLLELPTGSGKSFVIANFIYTLLQQYDSSLKTLIFVPNKQLVEQFYKDLLDYGFQEKDLAKLTGGVKKAPSKEARIIIGNRQFLFNNKDMLPEIDVLVADECHQISHNSSTFEFIEQINCPIKIGCSGTIPRDKYAKFSLIGLFSRIFYTEDIVKLQDEGFLTKLNITLLNIFDNDIANDTDILFNLDTTRKYSETNDIAFNEAFTAELEYITKNCEKLYAPAIDYIQNNFSGKNTLILFDRLEFGRKAFETAKQTNAWGDSKIYYVDGSIDVSEREKIRSEFERSNGNVLYAQTTTMGTGINIKNLSVIVFMFQTKSASRVIQSIGRTLRLHENKSVAEVVDVVFNYKYSKRHYKERLKLYRDFYMKRKPDKIVRLSVGLTA